MARITTTLTSRHIEAAQMQDLPIKIPNRAGLEPDDEDVTVVTADGEEFAGCYVRDVTETHVLIGVS